MPHLPCVVPHATTSTRPVGFGLKSTLRSSTVSSASLDSALPPSDSAICTGGVSGASVAPRPVATMPSLAWLPFMQIIWGVLTFWCVSLLHCKARSPTCLSVQHKRGVDRSAGTASCRVFSPASLHPDIHGSFPVGIRDTLPAGSLRVINLCRHALYPRRVRSVFLASPQVLG